MPPLSRVHADPDWVVAGPFRAHLAHVVSVTGLPWQVIALHAGVSLSLTSHLLFGRDGRRVTRVSADSARRILSITPASAASLRTSRVDAAPTVARLVDLIGRGHTVGGLAATLDLRPAGVLAVLEGRTPRVTAELSLRVLAARAAADRDAAWAPARAA